MKRKIFRTSMIVGVAVLLLSTALILGMMYQYIGNELTTELENEASLIARGVETTGLDYLEGLETTNRITWVDSDGKVLYDNVADPATMENHGDREEIQAALNGVKGIARRESATLSAKTFYVARRLEDGTVIRLAGAQSTAAVLLLSLFPPLLMILAVTLVLAAGLAGRMSKTMIQPILELDLEHPEQGAVYDELAPLLTRIRKQNETIQEQMSLLRQRQREFKTLTENMTEGFLLLDREGKVLSYNSGALRLLGAGEPEEGTDAFALNREDGFLRAVERALAGERTRERLDQESRSLELLANPVRSKGQTLGAVLVLLDVTERDRAEQLRREFTANVSHELKTPLTAISGMAEILQNGLVRPEDVAGFAGDIYRESRRLIALVEDIIHLSRLDEGGGQLTREPVELLALCQKVKDRLSALADSTGIVLLAEGEGCVVEGVPSVLEEIVYNLCDNAIKYNRPGGSVRIKVDTPPGGGRVTVADTGIGIPPQERERVFERFYRVDKSHSKEIGGTGLGLSIVKHGAALHDAQIELDSELGQGTTVRVTFPS